MKIIIDTNVILAALIKDGIVRRLVIDNAGEFITPEWCYYEVSEHRSVWNRNNLPDQEVDRIIDDLKTRYIISMEKKYYFNKQAEASELIDDPDDVPLIALALSIENRGIWTFNTKHFNTVKIKERITVLDTNSVMRMFEVKWLEDL